MDLRSWNSAIGRSGKYVVSALLLALSAGCVATNPFLAKDEAPSGNICQAVPVWDPRVAFAPDPVRGGAMGPGLVGRLYLFGPQIDYPLIGDGAVTVDLYKETAQANKLQHVLLEEWRIDPQTLKRLLKRDMIGWGYTLFLPWGTYNTEVTHVQIKLRYEPLKGAPLYAPPATLSLEHDDTAPAAAVPPLAQRAAPPAMPTVGAKPKQG